MNDAAGVFSSDNCDISARIQLKFLMHAGCLGQKKEVES